MARTMSDEQERDIRASRVPWFDDLKLKAVLAELDAERAAHDGTMAAWKAACEQINVEQAMNAALKARLALAEAVCESVDPGDYYMSVDVEPYEAWRAAK